MRLGTGVGCVLFTERLQLLTGRQDFHIQLIIADERDNLAVGINRVFTKHGTRGKARGLAELGQQELNGFFLRGHGEGFWSDAWIGGTGFSSPFFPAPLRCRLSVARISYASPAACLGWVSRQRICPSVFLEREYAAQA